jgi:hypothetical protein
LVHSLLVWCRPSDIARLVMAVIVFAVKRCALGSRSKFGVEILERGEAKLNAATAVLWIFREVGIGASCLRHRVRSVLPRYFTSDCLTVRSSSKATTATAARMARARAAVPEIADINGTLSAALASTQPVGRADTFKSRPIAKLLTRQVETFACVAARMTSGVFAVEKIRSSDYRGATARTSTVPHVRSSLALSCVVENGPLAVHGAGQILKSGTERFWNAMILLSHVGFTSHVKSLSVRLGRGAATLRRAVSILPQFGEIYGV